MKFNKLDYEVQEDRNLGDENFSGLEFPLAGNSSESFESQVIESRGAKFEKNPLNIDINETNDFYNGDVTNSEAMNMKDLMEFENLNQEDGLMEVTDFTEKSEKGAQLDLIRSKITVEDIKADLFGNEKEMNENADLLENKFRVSDYLSNRPNGLNEYNHKNRNTGINTVEDVAIEEFTVEDITTNEPTEDLTVNLTGTEKNFKVKESSVLDLDCSNDTDRVFEEFQKNWMDQNLEIIPNGDVLGWLVNPSDIVGVRHFDEQSDDDFWNHHGNSKDTYIELASKLPDVKKQLDSGISLDTIKMDETLRACAEQYYSPERMIKVYQYGENFIFNGDGRHRILAAKELGNDIPINMQGIYRKKG